MKYIKLLLILFFSIPANSQNLIKLSTLICDSISRNKEADSVEMTQASIYLSFLQKSFETDTALWKKNKIEQVEFLNSTNILLTRQLNKTCSYFKIKEALILPFTSLIDMDSVFSLEQKKKIINLCTDIKNKNGVEILVFTIDDLYPFNNIEDFSAHKQHEWNYLSISPKGRLLITFDKKSRKVRISTTQVSEQYFPDTKCQSIIDDTIIPEFKEGKYFDGIIDALNEIKKISS